MRPLLKQRKALIMGVINITPDSFSDGGRFNSVELAVEHGLALIEEGADIVDVGGESTRPGAAKVGIEEELNRVIPVIDALVKKTSVPISIDTHKTQVMRMAVNVGAAMINDISGLREDGALSFVSEAGVPVCIMHMQGDPETMQAKPKYQSVVDEVECFFNERISAAKSVGIRRNDLILDPGIGFGKTLQHNLQLLSSIARLRANTGCEVLVGVSRKSLIDELFGRPVDQRLAASLGLAVQAVLNGAKIVRVHDVRETYDAVRAVEAVCNSQ